VSSVLVIAGSDSSGGAGLTRDVRTLTQLDTRALCVVTAVTAQSDRQFTAVHVVPAEIVQAQMTATLATCRVDAIKIGMLATRATVLAVAATLPATAPPLVLDPVLASSSGGELLDEAGRSALCAALLAFGPQAVLLKGGHGEGPEATDLLLASNAPPRWLRAPRISAVRRGTGCALSSAIAAGLAAGLELTTACERAKQHVTRMLQHAD